MTRGSINNIQFSAPPADGTAALGLTAQELDLARLAEGFEAEEAGVMDQETLASSSLGHAKT